MYIILEARWHMGCVWLGRGVGVCEEGKTFLSHQNICSLVEYWVV